MPNNITIRFEIPFFNCIFWGWLPLEKADEIQVEEDNMQLTLKFTSECVLFPPGKELQISKETNYEFRTIIAQVIVHNIADDVIKDIHKIVSSMDPSVNSAITLAKRVVKFVTDRVNQIFSYARNNKGQYWLSKIEFDSDNIHTFLGKYNSHIKIDESEWVKWNPANLFVVRGKPVDPVWCIQKNDWPEVMDYVKTISKKPPLVNHLLAEAEWHAEQGHLRVALIEAVAALEAAINKYGNSSTASQHFESFSSPRIRAESFRSLINKHGTRGTIAVLFPIIFPEDKLPIHIIDDCLSAIDMRNNVIHQGKSEVDPVV